MNDKLKLIEAVLEDVLDKNVNISLETKLDDLEDWDSLTSITFFACLEDELGRELDLSKARECKTIENVVALIGG